LGRGDIFVGFDLGGGRVVGIDCLTLIEVRCMAAFYGLLCVGVLLHRCA
jgi:hypothetical protein